MHRETLAYRCFPKGQLEVEGGEDQRCQMLATGAMAVVAPHAADAAVAFALAAVAIAIAIAAPCDSPRNDGEATICPWHRTGSIGLGRS